MKDSLEQVTDSLSELAGQLKRIASRVDRRPSHKLRNSLMVLGGEVVEVLPDTVVSVRFSERSV